MLHEATASVAFTITPRLICISTCDKYTIATHITAVVLLEGSFDGASCFALFLVFALIVAEHVTVTLLQGTQVIDLKLLL